MRRFVRRHAAHYRWSRSAYHLTADAYLEARIRWESVAKSPPILVHQMGKSGSSSVVAMLDQIAGDRPIYHLHSLAHRVIAHYESSAQEKRGLGRLWVDPGRVNARFLRGQIDRDASRRWDVITTIREPVGRNVSALFQNAYRWIPDFDARCRSGQDLQEDLERAFWGHALHDTPLRWFEDEVRDVFGFDVYEHGFDHNRGYQIYENERLRLLVLRMESLDNAPSALADFLSLSVLPVAQRTNEASAKGYADVYRDFRSRIRFPEEYLQRMYNSEYARFFYTPEERARFRARWAVNSV